MELSKINMEKWYLVGVALLMFVVLTSCGDTPAGVRTPDGPPQLDRVSLVEKDSTTTDGSRGVTYVIWGNNLAATLSVTFSGAEANINPAYATDQNIIVTVPNDAPYANASDSLVVTNAKGSDSLPFNIIQPPPVINSFSPQAAGAGDIVTITGEVFDNVETVYFNEVEAEIISSTQTQIKVRVPEGIVSAKITVVTPGGETTAESSFGFKYMIYDNELNANFWKGGWGNTSTYDNTEHVSRGTNSIKVEYSAPWGGYQIGMNAPLSLADYSAIKLSIYSNFEGSILISLNGNYDATKVVELVKGEYINITVPLSVFGDPSELSQFVIQNQGTAGLIIYIDDLGLI